MHFGCQLKFSELCPQRVISMAITQPTLRNGA
jgi:hypothetical protein